ncbi:MAG TPA: hypothetical protein VKB80_06165 [Kofleriaceae bacterium]|nr:hypothetical protein [Kofleriaceae bacterium]
MVDDGRTDVDGGAVEEKGESLLQRVKDKAKGVHGAVADKLAETSEAAQEKVREKLAELNELVPTIRALGYSVDGIQVGIGLLPDVGIDVSGLARTMDAAAYERVLEEQKDNKVVSLIVRTLQTTSSWQQKIHFIDMGCDQATITLGIPPKVTLKFAKAGPS